MDKDYCKMLVDFYKYKIDDIRYIRTRQFQKWMFYNGIVLFFIKLILDFTPNFFKLLTLPFAMLLSILLLTLIYLFIRLFYTVIIFLKVTKVKEVVLDDTISYSFEDIANKFKEEYGYVKDVKTSQVEEIEKIEKIVLCFVIISIIFMIMVYFISKKI